MRQGCVLSPVLFNLYSEMLVCEALSETEGVKINGEKIKTMRYTDDTAVIATSEDELQRMMHKIQAKCDEYGMSLNTEKTKVMKIMANENDTVLPSRLKAYKWNKSKNISTWGA